MSLKTNVKLAKWAVTKSRRLVPHSTNLHRDKSTIQQAILFAMVRKKLPEYLKKQLVNMPFDARYATKEDMGQVFELANEAGVAFQVSLIDLALDLLQNFPDKHLSSEGLHYIEHLARKSAEFGVGNCSELSAVAFNLLLECPRHSSHGGDIPITRLSLGAPADHCFVVIGEAQGAEVTDIKTWGPEAVICDPWSEQVFNVADQLALPYGQRNAMFNFIVRSLFYCQETFKSCVSDGHSTRWLEKDRGDLRHTANFASQNFSLSFFPNERTQHSSDEGESLPYQTRSLSS